MRPLFTLWSESLFPVAKKLRRSTDGPLAPMAADNVSSGINGTGTSGCTQDYKCAAHPPTQCEP